MVHNGQRPSPCNQCEKSFNQKGNIFTHVKTHLNVKDLSCYNCELMFSRKDAMVLHQKRHFGRIKRISCDQCPKSYSSEGNLKIHQIVHSGKLPFSHRFCEKSICTKKREIWTHVKTNTGTNKTFACDQCGKCLATKASLQQHLRIHSKALPL